MYLNCIALELLLVIFIASQKMVAQPFINYSSQWNEEIKQEPFFGSGFTKTSIFQFRDSILIGNKFYHRLIGEDVEGMEYLAGLYREQNEKVFIYRNEFQEESLIYDFNIDTVGQILVRDNHFFQVIEIDSFALLNAPKRKAYRVIELDVPTTDTTWIIQGIGATKCFFDPILLNQEDLDGADCRLQCYFLQNEIQYSLYGRDSCITDFVSSNGRNREEKPQIFPNPSYGDVYFNYPKFKFLQIINYRGEVIATKQNSEALEAIYLHHLPAGIYFLTFIGRESKHTIRWIKR